VKPCAASSSHTPTVTVSIGRQQCSSKLTRDVLSCRAASFCEQWADRVLFVKC
jgi:hypothetical protein